MFEEYPMQKILDSFVTLQMVMNQIIEHLGINEYKLDHIAKHKKGSLDLFPGDIDGPVSFPCNHSPICLTVTPTARLWDGVEGAWDTDSNIPTDYETE